MFYGAKPDDKAVDAFLQGVKRYYRKLNDFTALCGGKHMVGDRVTTADFHIWEMTEQCSECARRFDKPNPLSEDFPALKDAMTAFSALPGTKRFVIRSCLFCSHGCKTTAHPHCIIG